MTGLVRVARSGELEATVLVTSPGSGRSELALVKGSSVGDLRLQLLELLSEPLVLTGAEVQA